jgi:hypothetical protein
MSESMVRTRRWTRAEYDKLIDAGFFGPGDKIELLGGQLCVSEPQNSPHAGGPPKGPPAGLERTRAVADRAR